MKRNELVRLIGCAAATCSLVLVILAASTMVQAQYSGSYGYGNDVYQIAAQQGYSDGYAHGADHARQGRRPDYAGTSHYRSATNGYRGYGSKDAYKQAYRDGFRRGYDAGYRSTGGYNTRSYGDNGYYRNDPYNRNNNPYYRNDPYYGNNPSNRNDPYYGRGGRGTYYPRGGYGRHGGRVRIVIPFRRH